MMRETNATVLQNVLSGEDMSTTCKIIFHRYNYSEDLFIKYGFFQCKTTKLIVKFTNDGISRISQVPAITIFSSMLLSNVVGQLVGESRQFPRDHNIPRQNLGYLYLFLNTGVF